MMQLNERQRDSVARILYDLGKIVFAVLVIGQFVPKEISHLSSTTLTLGFLGAIACFVIGLIFQREGEKEQ